MMGADAPIPPVVMNGSRPEGRPAAASILFLMKQFFVGVSLPGNTEASPPPPPPWGQGWRKGE